MRAPTRLVSECSVSVATVVTRGSWVSIVRQRTSRPFRGASNVDRCPGGVALYESSAQPTWRYQERRFLRPFPPIPYCYPTATPLFAYWSGRAIARALPNFSLKPPNTAQSRAQESGVGICSFRSRKSPESGLISDGSSRAPRRISELLQPESDFESGLNNGPMREGNKVHRPVA